MRGFPTSLVTRGAVRVVHICLMGVVQKFALKINLNMYIARPSFQHSRDNIVHIALKSSSDETLCKSSANTLPSFLPSALWMRHRHPPSPAPLPTKTCCEARLGGWIPHHGGGRAPRVSLSCLLCDVVVMVFLANKWRADVAAFL